MSNYTQGREVEYAVAKVLRETGYVVLRSAKSHGIADVVAFGPGVVLVVQCKRERIPSPLDRAQLLALAALTTVTIPLVVIKPRGQGQPEFRRLTGVGPGEWEPWSPVWGDS